MRADAARNRDRILDVAADLIARDGADVSMDDIATGAGVAVGTLYRHYATKAALVAAVIDRRVRSIADAAVQGQERVAAGASAGEELSLLFRQIAEQHAVDAAAKAASVALGHPYDTPTGATDPSDDRPEDLAWQAIESLLASAQASGELRADVGMADLLALLNGVPTKDVPASVRERYVEVVLAGLRTPPA